MPEKHLLTDGDELNMLPVNNTVTINTFLFPGGHQSLLWDS